MKTRSQQQGSSLLPLSLPPAFSLSKELHPHTHHPRGVWHLSWHGLAATAAALRARLAPSVPYCYARLVSVPLYCYAVLLGLILLGSKLILAPPIPREPRPGVHTPTLHATNHTNGTYAVPMGYWTSHLDYTFPTPDPHYSHSVGFIPWWATPSRHDCFQLAMAVREPYSQAYRPRHGSTGPGPFPGGAPRGLFRWDPGRITRHMFDSVPHWLRGPRCLHCVDALRFKIFKGQLYVLEQRHVLALEKWHADVAIEQLLVLLHLYPDFPDTDFIIHFGDGCTDGLPVLNWNIRRDWPLAGFAYPSYSAWQMSLGIAQSHEFYSCLASRYPLDQRRSSVFWRGSTTNPHFFAEEQEGGYRNPLNRTNMFQVPRVQLHMMSRQHQPDLDWRIFRILGHEDSEYRAIKRNLPGRARKSRFEDFNANAMVLDVDGNGWSDRFVQLLRFNTPVLKQASNLSAFFEHLAAPGEVVEYFAHDLSDVVDRAQALLTEYKSNASRLHAMAQKMQGLSAVMLTHLGLTEALAYTLQVYGSMADWKVQLEPAYRLLSPTLCCKYTNLPKEVILEMHKRGSGSA